MCVLTDLRGRHDKHVPPVLAQSATIRQSEEVSLMNAIWAYMPEEQRVVHRITVRRETARTFVMQKSGLAEDMLVLAEHPEQNKLRDR